MKWYERLYKTKARKYLLIGLLTLVLPAGTAVTVGGALDAGIDEALTEESAAAD